MQTQVYLIRFCISPGQIFAKCHQKRLTLQKMLTRETISRFRAAISNMLLFFSRQD